MTWAYLKAWWRLRRARLHEWNVQEQCADYEHQAYVASVNLDHWTAKRSAASVAVTLAEKELDQLTKLECDYGPAH